MREGVKARRAPAVGADEELEAGEGELRLHRARQVAVAARERRRRRHRVEVDFGHGLDHPLGVRRDVPAEHLRGGDEG